MTAIQEQATQQTNPKEGQLKAILFLLQTYFEERKDEADRSYALLQVGEKTPLLKQIEDSIDRPLESLFESADDVFGKIENIIDVLVKTFLVHVKDYIHSAYRTDTACNDLHYSIILVQDDIETRDRFLEFYDLYDQFDGSRRFPVYFQFIAPEREDNIMYAEKIEWENV